LSAQAHPRLAVLSDLHANLSACLAVAADLHQRQPDQILVLGDLVGYLTRPNEVVDLIARSGWACLTGNYDQALLLGGEAGIEQYLKPGIGPDPRAIFAWTETQVGPASRDFLAALPRELRLTLGGRRILAVHGSPAGIRHYVYPDHPEAELAAWLSRERADILLMGHTHQPFVRTWPQGLVVNPGSMGKPKDGDPRASYALIELGPEVKAEIVRLEYDLDLEAHLLKKAGLPAKAVEKLYQGV
jgi:putative phosphoesterase